MATPVENPGGMSALMKAGIGVPIGLISILAMMILPLPAFMLDVLFTFNIALSLVIVMAVFQVKRPLEFAIFPTVLLPIWAKSVRFQYQEKEIQTKAVMTIIRVLWCLRITLIMSLGGLRCGI